ncbi:MAG TPA: helix-hairpin-helix domain-containing protein, partial [Armatimonadota bacterium]|nr:helix-hairpin-helix domain-containing protein [Armatimonadota bacterium]
MSLNEEIDLSQIPGLGPVRRAALAEAGVQDLRGLLQMKLEELAAIHGVGLWQARKIREFLRQRGLLIETADDGTGAIAVHAPQTETDAQAVAAAAALLEAQAERETEAAAEVELLTAAVTEAQEREPQQPEPKPRRRR